MEQGLLLVEKIKSKRKKIIQALKGAQGRRRFYEAETLHQGLQIISKEKIDLILYHPESSNHQSKKGDLSPLISLKEHEIVRDIPLLYIDPSVGRSEKMIALEKGAWDFFDGPFNLKDLVLKAEILLRIKAGQDKLKSRIRQLEKLSIIDSLTGLYNRRHLKEYLNREVKRADRQKGQIYCIMMDVDNFKGINDQLGHPKGDQVLQEIGVLLRSLLRSYDFPARYGGDEFTIVFQQRMEEREVMSVAERIRQKISSQTFCQKRGKQGIQLTVSLGLSFFPSQDVGDDDALIATADEALYLAKRKGKNQIIFYRSNIYGPE